MAIDAQSWGRAVYAAQAFVCCAVCTKQPATIQPAHCARTCSFDKAICIYEFDKLDKPREAFQRMRKCHTAAIVSMAYDHTANCILSGSIDGSMKVRWGCWLTMLEFCLRMCMVRCTLAACRGWILLIIWDAAECRR